jgi:transposase
MDGYIERQMKFGTMSMIVNVITLPPHKIYENYKSRMEIETLFDAYKNLLKADRTYMQSDNAMEAWMFLNHLSMIMYYNLYNKLKRHNMLSRISPADVLMRLSKINKIRINNSWLTSEINSKTLNLIKTLDIHIT